VCGVAEWRWWVDAEKERYVEDFGLLWEQLGGQPRMVGRVFGALMIAAPPEVSSGELREALGASKGAVSHATRALEQLGFVRRVSRRGERGDYFRVTPGVWDEMMRRDLESNRIFLRMAERGLDLLAADDPEAHRSLEEMREFYRYRDEKLSEALEGWQEKGKVRDDPA
jgi:DNA-binding transcriptional regulator GbsR (MarR family)